MTEDEAAPATEELTSDQKRDNVVRLAFGGRHEAFDEFVRIVREAIPEGTGVVLRGSAVTGQRWKDGAPFDADGPGTSDLDLTLVGGDEVIGLFSVTGFCVPGMHSRPHRATRTRTSRPDLVPLRQRLMGMVRRPVNIQASRDVVLYFRGELHGPAVPRPHRQGLIAGGPAGYSATTSAAEEPAKRSRWLPSSRPPGPTSWCCRKRRSRASWSSCAKSTGMAQWASTPRRVAGFHEPRKGRATTSGTARGSRATPFSKSSRPPATCGSSACT